MPQSRHALGTGPLAAQSRGQRFAAQCLHPGAKQRCANEVTNETADHQMHREQQKVLCSPLENGGECPTSARPGQRNAARLSPEHELPINFVKPGAETEAHNAVFSLGCRRILTSDSGRQYVEQLDSRECGSDSRGKSGESSLYG